MVSEYDGKDLEDALRTAAEALGRQPGELEYELLEGGRKGVFGLGAKPVRIRVTTSPAAAPSAPPPARARDAEASGPAHELRGMVRLMGFDLTVEEMRRDGSLELVMDGPDRKTLTARDGELLTAIEFLLNRMGRRRWPDAPPFRLVCKGFRNERDEDLVELIREVATQVSRSGQPKRLHAMNPYERRVVHMTVREFDGLTTVSEGDGFLKRVRVEKLTR